MKHLLLIACLSISSLIFGQMDLRLQDPASSFIDDVTYIDSLGVLICGGNYFGTTIDDEHSWYAVGYGGMFVRAAVYPSIRFGIGVGDGGKFRKNTSCGYYWGWSSALSVGVFTDLKDVDMPNDVRATVVGASGTIVSTHDQALTWNTLSSGTSLDLNGVKMINDSVAFVCGNNGIVLKLVNDVVVSTTVLNASINLNKITFATDSLGFIVGNSGRVYRTTDQGTNWTELPSWGAYNITNVDFSSPTHGAICGTNNFLYYTNDGGTTWTQSTVHLTPSNFEAIAFENDLEGYATGNNFIMRTIDGGSTWIRRDISYRSIDFTTPNDGYVIGYGGAKRTSDGGNSWEVMDMSSPAYYNDINFTDPSIGVAVGSLTISRTIDGGDNWTTVAHPAANATLIACDFITPNQGIVVGTKKTLLTTSNGGTTWTYSYQSSSTLTYSDVKFTSTSTAYICTGGATFLKTTNGGLSWTTSFLPVNVYYTKLFFLNDNVGWVIGNSGTILKTTNGGASWIVQNSGVTEGLTGIHFSNANDGIIVGQSGTYLATHDGGATWTDYSYGSIDYADLSFTSNGIGFVASPYRVASIGRPTIGSNNYPLCPGENEGYNSFEPYYDNGTVRSMVLEFDTQYGDFSSGTVLTTTVIDSVGSLNYFIPDTITIGGVYKTRLRDLNDPTYVSGEKFYRVTTPPTLTYSIVNGNLVAQSSMPNALFYWYYRATPQSSTTLAGIGDTLPITATGEYRVSINNTCCATGTDWFVIELCNGNYVNQADFTYVTNETICYGDSLLWEGTYRSASGTYDEVYVNTAGCDSIQRLELTVRALDSTSIVTTICFGDSVLFNGNYYSQTGIYTDVLTNSFSCDSILSLNLNVLPPSFSETNLTVCYGDSALSNGNYYTQSGSYTDTLTTTYGCDSLVTLNLSVLPYSGSQSSVTLCFGDSIQFNGNYLSQTGLYVYTLTSTSSCDSITQLDLVVLPPSSFNESLTICEGDSVPFGGSFVHIPGNYVDTLQTTFGCDSIIAMDLTVLPLPTISLGADIIECAPTTVTLDAGAGFTSYLWSTSETSQTIEITSDSLDYWVEVTAPNGCTNSDTVLVAILDCSSIDELSNALISIYPNPTSGTFFVKSATELDVLIYDQSGRFIERHSIFDSPITVQLPTGNYRLVFLEGSELKGMKSILVE